MLLYVPTTGRFSRQRMEKTFILPQLKVKLTVMAGKPSKHHGLPALKKYMLHLPTFILSGVKQNISVSKTD